MPLSRRTVTRLSIISSAVILLLAPGRSTTQLVADDLPKPIPTAAVPVGGPLGELVFHGSISVQATEDVQVVREQNPLVDRWQKRVGNK